ncbi:MAG: hypothetical protein EB090_01335 [Verrucomicrobia bacterium]|nr:hypothetical protein [Verrucomicrobiota bacterium]
MICLGVSLGLAEGAVTGQDPDPTAERAAGIVAGLDRTGAGRVMLNEKTGRLEVRDEAGILIDEISAGSAGRAVDVCGQEYRLSFGKDDMGRKSVLVRAGPAMRKPITIELFGRKAVLSTDASLLATLVAERQVFYEPSVCGQVYYIDRTEMSGNEVSRLATPKREVAVMAQPSNPTGASPSLEVGKKAEDDAAQKKAGEAVKSALFTIFGLPDKQPSAKAKVYRLRGNSDGGDPSSGVAAPASAEAGRP